MSATDLALAAVNLGLIGLLPRIFFDGRGRKNAMWWATASPFIAAGAVLVLCFTGIWQPWGTDKVTASRQQSLDEQTN